MSAALLVGVAGCGEGSSRASLGDRMASASIPLDLSGPRPIARLAIGDHAPVRVIFDSGAAASILKLAYAQSIGLPDEGEANAAGPGGSPVAGFRTTIVGRLGNAGFASALAVAIDIPLPLPEVMGVVGPSVFSGRLVTMDFPAGVARVTPATAANTPHGAAHAYSGGGLFTMAVSRRPTAALAVGQSTVITVDLDSGYDGGIELPLSMSRRLRLAGPLVPGRTARMIGASRRTFAGVLADDIRLGSLILTNQPVTFVEGDTAPPKVGMKILRRSVVVFDPQGYRDWVL